MTNWYHDWVTLPGYHRLVCSVCLQVQRDPGMKPGNRPCLEEPRQERPKALTLEEWLSDTRG
jgi:hypothetical protein